MLRASLNRFCDNINCNLINYQSVRWRRKPRWMPVAKSKLFKVPERPVVPIEEKLELMRLNNNYHTQERAIRYFLRLEVQKEYAGSNKFQVTPEEELEDLKECSKINDEWNKQVALLRSKRLAEAEIAKQKFIDEEIKRKDTLKLQKLAQVEEQVLKLQEEYKTFITPENIDSAIEAAMVQIVDYNFSIDRNGTMFKGRTTEEKKQ